MEENKTGVWIQDNMSGKIIKYNPRDGMAPFNVGDVVEVENDDVYAMFKIETVEFKGNLPITETYMIRLHGKVSKTTQPWQYATFDDAEPIEMDVYRDGRVNILVPYWYEKVRYRLQSIKSTEATIIIRRITRKETMNEDIEIYTDTISADEIKTDVLSTSPPEPITAMSEAEKNWWKECCGGSEIERGLRSQIQTLDDWNGEMSATLTFSQEKIDEIMNKLVGIKKEKKMYTENLKEMIKKPIYVDKEITVKEPMLDNNGKQIEKDGKPVFKIKHYHGMVKVLWNCGAETVAYVEGNDVYDTENLCKLEKILEKDKKREEERKGLPHAKFLRRIGLLSGGCVAGKLIYKNCDMKYVNEFKKLAKKYFPELKGKEIYVNGNKNDEIFVAIK
jgi:hypothetical protein